MKKMDMVKGLVFHHMFDGVPVCESLTIKKRGAVRYGDHFIHQSVLYATATRNGDCGLPVFAADSNTRCEKIVGFHVAGTADKRVGFGNVLT